MGQEITSATESHTLSGISQKAGEIADQINQYADLLIGSLFMITGGIFAIYLIHKIASKFLFPHFHKGRLTKVAGVTVYALILLTTTLIVLRSVGVDVAGIGQIALVTILVIAVLSFFLLPFLPKLPFKIGHLLEVGGELGTVVAISPLFTALKTYGGALVFVPNAAIMKMTIKNYSHDAFRRIEINMSVQNDTGLEKIKAALIRLMTENECVMEEPSTPAIFLTNANAEYIELLAVCWVRNEDWLTTQSDLWEKIVNAADEGIHLANPYFSN